MGAVGSSEGEADAGETAHVKTTARQTSFPEQSIPPALLSRAYAVAVIPDVVKIGFVVGARRGKGVLVVRKDDNTWSNPVFITLTGGSLGWQIGAQSTDIVLVFKNRKGVDGITNGTLTLGADVSAQAPAGSRRRFPCRQCVFRQVGQRL